jgi:hypothetical protein
LITLHPDNAAIDGDHRQPSFRQKSVLAATQVLPERSSPLDGLTKTVVPVPMKSSRASGGITTQMGYINRNNQEVMRSTGKAGTDHGQYIYVLRCRCCGHEYGANGSDIQLRRCPNHDRGAPGLVF